MGKMDNTPTITNEQKKAAAYALNMCMVSVSQIIDYDDLYVLEQEYDGILNNLNLEKMPKDEALLNLLKQLLDTISYFRITEKERGIFEAEYQQRMRNAIWSAVPNVGLISTGGSLLSTGISLASQVGIGYMNYRREKARILLDKEKNEWQLQRTAMEQFHGLRRELFDTAWRLADHYSFPDEYRITERQIAEYNATLLDDDVLRRYERLYYMRDKFEAYPPFWYQLGSTANVIAHDIGYTEEIRSLYLSYAQKNFLRYLDETEHNLLREDPLLASCALEYFDIVLQAKRDKAGKATLSSNDKADLKKILDRARKAAGNKYDVLQLCALSYLRMGEQDEGMNILRMLVNNSYNKVVNSQLLSNIYVYKYIHTKKEQTKRDILINYNTLSIRVGGEYLFPLPMNGEGQKALETAFIQAQKHLLSRKVSNALKAIAEKYTILYNQAIPAADLEDNHPDEYYSDGLLEVRMEDISNLMGQDNPRKSEFLQRMGSYVTSVFDVLNKLYVSLGKMHGIDEKELFDRLTAEIQQHSEKFNNFLEAKALTKSDIETLFSLDFKTMTANAFAYVLVEMWRYINGLNGMEEIAAAEAEIQNFCTQEGLPAPEAALYGSMQEHAIASKNRKIDLTLLGRAGQMANYKAEKKRKMLACLKQYKDKLILEDGKEQKIDFSLDEPKDERFKNYKQKNRKVIAECTGDLLAVIDDTAWGSGDGDLLFTTVGVVHYKEGAVGAKAANTIPYDKIKQGKGSAILLGKITYKDSQIDMKELFSLIQELAEIKSSSFSQRHGRIIETMSELSDRIPNDLLQLPMPKDLSLPAGIGIEDHALIIRAINFEAPGQCGVTAEVLGDPVHVGDHYTVFKNGMAIGENSVTVKTLRVNGYDLSMAQPGEHVTLFLSIEGIEYSDLEGALLKKEDGSEEASEQGNTVMGQEDEIEIFPTEEDVLALLKCVNCSENGQKEVKLDKEDNIEYSLVEEEIFELEKEKINKMAAKANNVVLAAVATASTTGAIPIPFADAPLLIAQQTALMMEISHIFNIDMKEDGLKTLVTTVLGVGGATVAGKMVASNLLKLVPFAGSVLGGAISAGTAGGITFALGNAFIDVCKDIKLGRLSEDELVSQAGIDLLQDALKEKLKR